MKIKLPPIKAGKGHGFLKKMTPGQMLTARSPQFRGEIVAPEDFREGRRLKLIAWMHTNHLGTVHYLTVVTRKLRIAHRRKLFQQAQEEREEYAKIIAAKAKHEAGPVPKIRPKPVPKEVRRKDII